jgi:hypothetical protein
MTGHLDDATADDLAQDARRFRAAGDLQGAVAKDAIAALIRETPGARTVRDVVEALGWPRADARARKLYATLADATGVVRREPATPLFLATAEALAVQVMLPRVRALLVEDVRVVAWLLAGRPVAAATAACHVVWWALVGWAAEQRRDWVTWLRGLRGLRGRMARRMTGTLRGTGHGASVDNRALDAHTPGDGAGTRGSAPHQHVRHGQRRRALLADLATIARSLSDDELHVVVTIAHRASVGQRRYGCLRLAHDNRDFRREALEEACDGCFYLAAGLLRLSARTRRLRGRWRGARG